jgi:hypothetical protein
MLAFMGEENICSSLIYFLIQKFSIYGGEGGLWAGYSWLRVGKVGGPL